MALRIPRPLRLVAAGLLGLTLATALAPAASASTTRHAFTSVASTPNACQTTVITQITGSPGVRYYLGGHRLHLPSGKLRFDEAGAIELTARAKGGAALDRYRYRLLAPAGCFGSLTVDDQLPRYQPTVSWCTDDPSPAVAQAFVSDDDVRAAYTLLRRTSHADVASGISDVSAGEGEATFALPAGLPRGRYLLEARDPADAPSLYPWSMAVEELRCLPAPTARTGRVTFRVPKHGPAALLTLSVPSEVDPVRVVRVRAGHTYTFRTSEPAVLWVATPTGDHVGELGHGTVAVPQG